ncbi:Hypothetical Protein RradSPS_1506 [Rubrobacter radiotolerans]|uniref:Cell division protein FtsL n=1 Tax=Rubrobacter radiotolerans TaxID=42256 RepID=A0A023X403_RUBRA|nr:hypothetical protein [Rubrobacter radiotolerans]AHY46789.1 Hypothetical Protein RradSPS_1506 [Rubrobacter radiotolerans]MDX5894196.1 hypothetical protein [Rubrobacter radiotolerans]SMC05452.1 cell division protein FtsL [Rubrobacter radiotolerans DSM 5868]
MAAPNYGGYDRVGYVRARGELRLSRPIAPERREAERAPSRDVRRKVRRVGRSREERQAALRRRRFVVVVILPVLLLLGSVYLHNVASNTEASVADLESRIAEAESRYEQLGVREARLSNSERIRSLAAKDQGMKAPAAAEIETLEAEAGDGSALETPGP